MSTMSPNLGLTLPIGSEKVSRQVINNNMMIIDGNAGNLDFNPEVMFEAIMDVQDVTHAKIFLNRSNTAVDGIPAKSLLALVNNGGKTNICQAIHDTNTSGLETTGTLEKEIDGVTIKFSRPTLLAIHFNIVLEGFTAPDLTDLATAIRSSLMAYINRKLQIGEILYMDDIRQLVYDAAGSDAANFRIKDLSCSGAHGVSRGYLDPGWNKKFTMSSANDVTITSTTSSSSEAITALNNNVKILQDEGVYYGTCSTAATTRDKAVTCTNFPSSLKAGQKLSVKFTNGDESTSYARMTVNSLTRKNIQYVSGSTMLNIWKAGEVVDFVYDGTAWIVASGSTYKRIANVAGVWVSTTMPSSTGTTAKIADFPTDYTYSDCHIECAYVTYSSAKYAIPDGQASLWLQSDGIYANTSSGGYRSSPVKILLRNDTI